jgi:hypothetical protein
MRSVRAPRAAWALLKTSAVRGHVGLQGQRREVNVCPFSWIDLVIPLEHAHVRVERMGAIQLYHLPNVAEVVEGKLVQERVEAEDTKFFVLSGAGACRCGQRVEPGQGVAPPLFECLELRAAVPFLSEAELVQLVV